jgi:hypothetical protein
MRISNKIVDEYESFLKREGSARFYSYVLGTGSSGKHDYRSPDVMLLNQSDSFFSLFRSTGNQHYFMIGVLLRKAAHKLYRDLYSKGNIPQNRRFLQIVA